MVKMSELDFINCLDKMGISVSSFQKEKFRQYCDFLIKYNEHCNLTAIKTTEEVYLKHFYDSLMILKNKQLNKEKILDIGSGAGFPGVPLKIICPNIQLTCLDSNGKKTQFLMMLREKIGLDFDIVNERAEDYIKNNRESYDCVVCRAVASMPVICELSIPFLKIGGYVIAYRGSCFEDNGKYAAEILGAEISEVYTELLPKENAKRTFICIQKKCKTDAKFPRKYDKIIKYPLQNIEK